MAFRGRGRAVVARPTQSRIGTWLESELLLRQLRSENPALAQALDRLGKAMGIGPTPEQRQDDQELLGIPPPPTPND